MSKPGIVPTYLPRRLAHEALKEHRVLWIDPARISWYVGSSFRRFHALYGRLEQISARRKSWRPLAAPARDLLYALEPFWIPARRYPQPIPIEEERRNERILDLLSHRDDVSRSRWYRGLLADLRVKGEARYKARVFRSEADIAAFFDEYVGDLIAGMHRHGYLREKASDLGNVLIAADGSLQKTAAGNHRFAIARALGVSRFPVLVLGAHEDWAARVVAAGDRDALRTAVRAVEAAHQGPCG